MIYRTLGHKKAEQSSGSLDCSAFSLFLPFAAYFMDTLFFKFLPVFPESAGQAFLSGPPESPKTRSLVQHAVPLWSNWQYGISSLQNRSAVSVLRKTAAIITINDQFFHKWANKFNRCVRALKLLNTPEKINRAKNAVIK